MSKKTRYLIIACCFISFIIAAPLIVLYVRGITYDFQNKRFIRTGIISIRTEPKNADVFLNDELVGKKAGDIKFLKPNEYLVSIKKPGFFDWTKRLMVFEGQVTWANPANNKIYLLLQKPEALTIASSTLDFYLGRQNLFVLEKNRLAVFPLSGFLTQQQFDLPKTVDQIIVSPNSQRLALISSNASTTRNLSVIIIDRQLSSVSDISNIFTKYPLLQFSPGNELYALEDGNLYQIGFQNKQKILQSKDISAFSFGGDNFYYIKKDGFKKALLAGSSFSGNGQKIIGELPDFQRATIYINFQKQIFLLLDEKLYKVGSDLELKANGVKQVMVDQNGSNLIVIHEGELSYFSASSDKQNFITRSILPLADPILKPEIDYALCVKENKIVAIELDLRDHQNEYILYQGSDVKKFSIDDVGKQIWVLDGQELINLKIR